MQITAAQIVAAQSNDTFGLGAVLTALEPTVTRLAAEASRRLPNGQREDLEQDAREALFIALGRFDAGKVKCDVVDGFMGFMFQTMRDALKDRVRETRYEGADKDAVKVFMSMREQAGDDPYLTAKLAQTVPPKGVRLSADRAEAARLAWQGAAYLVQQDGDDEYNLADSLAVVDETPDEIRPKVGHGAALEALAVLQTYSAARSVLSALPAKPEDVDAIEDALTVPRDPEARRYVLDAVAILRSYVSTVADGDLATDLRDVTDERRDERAAKIETVHTALAKMSPAQRRSLHLTWGINGEQEFGDGDGCDLAGMAEAMNTTTGSAKKTRSVAKLSFEKHYVPMVATSEDDAAEWHAAAAEERKAAGRK
jgi:DNA-directed RNA polymerase specialized sigma24 family protein